MKKALILLSTALTFSLFATGEMPDLDWKVVNGKMANWSGAMAPASNGSVSLKKGISYSKRKYLIGEKRKVQVNFSIQGTGSGIGVYYYAKNGAFLGRAEERIPNADSFRSFEAVFELPEKAKKQDVFSFRIYFNAPKELQIKEIKMKFTD